MKVLSLLAAGGVGLDILGMASRAAAANKPLSLRFYKSTKTGRQLVGVLVLDAEAVTRLLAQDPEKTVMRWEKTDASKIQIPLGQHPLPAAKKLKAALSKKPGATKTKT